MSSGCVIAGFPAVGKTTYAAARPETTVDSDSSRYSWKWTSPETRQRHPEWPGNYIEHIKAGLYDAKTVLVSTHAEVRAALHEAGIPFTIVMPDRSLRVEYLVRMARRDSPLALIELVDKSWEDWMDQLIDEDGEQIILGRGQYLQTSGPT